jgi:uncharacterized protein
MGNMIGFLLFVSFAAGGSLIFTKLSVPSAAILGGVAFVAIANLCSVPLRLPQTIRFMMSVSVGVSIGGKFNIKIDKKLMKYLLMSSTLICGVSLLIGLILHAIGVEKTTATYGALLGGLTEMSFIAQEFHFDSFQVSLFHTVRMCTLLVLIPFVANRLPKEKIQKQERRVSAVKKARPFDWLFIIVLAAGSAWLLSCLKVPAGNIVGTIGATAVYSKTRNVVPKFNKKLYGFILALVGGSIGLEVNLASIQYLPNLVVPMLVYILMTLLFCFALAKLLEKVAHMDKMTALFAASPGGLAPGIIMASDMGADASIVSIFQLVRYFTVIFLAIVIGFIFNG